MLTLKRADASAGLRRLPALVADLLLPPTCPGCGGAISDSHALCGRCWSTMRFIAPPICGVYGTPFSYGMGEGIVSAEALADPPPFRRARSAAVFGDTARRLVHQLKYYDRPHLARVMARTMHHASRDLIADCALIVPVPLHPLRLWSRRFNQSAALAAELSKLSGLPVGYFALQRVKPTKQQVGLTAAQRTENVRAAFRVAPRHAPRLAQVSILLVDDVYTSGATVKAASRALLRAGAAAVDVVTFARVVGQ